MLGFAGRGDGQSARVLEGSEERDSTVWSNSEDEDKEENSSDEELVLWISSKEMGVVCAMMLVSDRGFEALEAEEGVDSEGVG